MQVHNPISAWRKYAQRYTLQGVKCVKCGKVYFPGKLLCTCGGLEFAILKLSGGGKLVTFTKLHAATEGFASDGDYCLGIIQLDEGPRIMAQMAEVDFEKLYIGMPVAAVFRKYFVADEKDIIHYGIKFLPKV
jgi:hypothetical protein